MGELTLRVRRGYCSGSRRDMLAAHVRARKRHPSKLRGDALRLRTKSPRVERPAPWVGPIRNRRRPYDAAPATVATRRATLRGSRTQPARTTA